MPSDITFEWDPCNRTDYIFATLVASLILSDKYSYTMDFTFPFPTDIMHG